MSGGFNPDVFKPLAPPPPLGADTQHKLDKEMRKVGKGITINGYVGTVICIISTIITLAILLISSTLNQDRKMFLGGVLIVLMVGMQIVICLVRSDPTTLIFLTTISVAVSTFTAGLAFTYA